MLASFAAVAVLIYLPSFWVRRVMRLYGGDSVDIPGTGAELARHLIDRFQLTASLWKSAHHSRITLIQEGPQSD